MKASSRKQLAIITTRHPNNNSRQQKEYVNKSRASNKRRKVVCFSTQPDSICNFRYSPPTEEEMNANNKPKVVRFSTHDDIFHCKDLHLTNEEMKSIWYSNNDMIRIKKEAKNSARRLRAIFKSSDSIFENEEIEVINQRKKLSHTKLNRIVKRTSLMTGSVDESRGLEFHIFTERRMKNQIAMRTIMKYQRIFKSKIAIAKKTGNPNLRKLVEEVVPEALRIISSRCTRWARNIALEDGKLDFKEAYGIGREEIAEIPLLFDTQKSLSGRLGSISFEESKVLE